MKVNVKTEEWVAPLQQGFAITPRLSGALFVVLSAIGFGIRQGGLCGRGVDRNGALSPLSGG